MQRRRDWTATITRLNQTSSGRMSVLMGSPGSAQVTRCRLLEKWNHLEVTTEGARIHLRLV